MLLGLICAFQIQARSSSQAAYDLEQFEKLPFWSELKYSSSLSASFLQKLETLEFWAVLSGEWERLSPGMYRNLNIWGSLEERNKPSRAWWPSLAWLSLPWEAFWEFSLRLLRNPTTASLEEPMWSVDYLFCKQISVDLVCLEEMKVILERKILCFQWILNSRSVNWGLYL